MTAAGVREAAAARGVATAYRDGVGTWHEVPDATLEAVLAALGDAGHHAHLPPVVVATQGGRVGWAPPPGERAVVVLEGGGELALPAQLPGELPLGYHRVVGRSGETRLVVAPPRCYLPRWLAEGARTWGWAAQLYALRSCESWGAGDLGDLARLAGDGLGAGFVLLNPVHVRQPGEPSPYSPSSRRFRDPLYLRVEGVPEAAALDGDHRARLAALARAGRALNLAPRIDRDAVGRLKEEALRLCWQAHQRLPRRREAFAAWRATHPALESFAAFCGLQRELGADWREWPAAFRRPDAPAPARWRERHPDEAGYHAFLQWLLDEQLAAVPPLRLGLVTDLAVGVAPDGFDAWSLQDALAPGMHVGAPPDALGPDGQDWGLPPFAPGRLAVQGYEPFAATLRAVMARAAGVRVDHVMGLFRLFWIPQGASPAEGTYVPYPAEDLLGVLALESWRAGALVIGEDLGTVAAGVRERLAAAAVLSYRLVLFERHPAVAWPRLALAAATTHDLPTLTGLFSGADLAELREIGVVPPGQAGQAAARQAREVEELRALLAAEGLAPPGGDLVAAVYAFLARTPSLLVAASLEDAARASRRPNVPGTGKERPNWRLALPLPLEELLADERARALADGFRAAGR